MKKLTFTLSVLASLFITQVQAQSAVLDQPSPALTSLLPLGTVSTTPPGAFIAQSFTAGVTGNLEKVNLMLSVPSTAVNVKVSVFVGSKEGNNLGTVALGETTVSVSSKTAAYVSALFTNLSLTKNTKYTVKVLVATTGTFVFHGASNTTYTSGVLHTNSTTFTNGDLTFQTYMKDVTTSLTDTYNNESIELFPNPTYGKLQFGKTLKGVQIVSLDGEILINDESEVDNIDISTLPKGVYLLISEGINERITKL